MFILDTANVFYDFLRGFFGGIDRILYRWLAFVTNLSFTISDFTITPPFITAFTARIYVIISIFMLFRLAISLLNGIVNPDSLIDKNTGMQKIIPRIIVSLSLLIFLPTVLFPKLLDWTPQIANTIPKIILGVNNTPSYDMTEDIITGKTIGTVISSAAVGTFITPSTDVCSATEDISDEENVDYSADLPTDLTILDDDIIKSRCIYKRDVYAYDYAIPASSLVGLILLLVMLSFCLDFAIRSIKLCILQVLAPIPIISYISPKAGKDSAFSAWLRTFVSTYLELFIKMAIVFFVLFIIQQVIQVGVQGSENGVFVFASADKIPNSLMAVAKIFIIIGLLFFARQAPKFISDMLGLKKGAGGSLGLSGLLAGTSAFFSGAGIIGSGAAALDQMSEASSAIAQGKQVPSAWSRGRDIAANMRGEPQGRSVTGRMVDFARMMKANSVGLSDRDIQAQKGAVEDAQDSYNKAAFAEKNARSRWEGFVMSEDLKAWSERGVNSFSEPEPKMPEITASMSDQQISEMQSAYFAEHAQWQHRKELYGKQQQERFDAFQTTKADLYKEYTDAHNATLAAKVVLDKRTNKLNDAKESRKTMLGGDRSSKYNAKRGNHFEHD